MVCDVLYYNGVIYTMDEEIEKANWVAVSEGKIYALGMGEPKQIEAKKYIDLEKKIMLPGFIESHMHGTATGESLCAVDVYSARNIKELLAIVAEGCKVSGDDSPPKTTLLLSIIRIIRLKCFSLTIFPYSGFSRAFSPY